MKTAPIIALVIVSLLLWSAMSPSANTSGETRLDDIIKSLLGVKVVPYDGSMPPTTGTSLLPVTIPGTTKSTGKTLPPIGSGNSVFMVPSTNSKGLFE